MMSSQRIAIRERMPNEETRRIADPRREGSRPWARRIVLIEIAEVREGPETRRFIRERPETQRIALIRDRGDS